MAVPVVCFHVTLTVRNCLTSGPHPDHWFLIPKEKFDDVTVSVVPVDENSCVYLGGNIVNRRECS